MTTKKVQESDVFRADGKVRSTTRSITTPTPPIKPARPLDRRELEGIDEDDPETAARKLAKEVCKSAKVIEKQMDEVLELCEGDPEKFNGLYRKFKNNVYMIIFENY